MGKISVVAAALIAAAVVAITSGCGGSGKSHDAAAATRADGTPRTTITVSGKTVARRIPTGFLGVGTELVSLEDYAGTNPHAPDPIFQQLLRNLSPGHAPVFRLGGDSTDWSWWPAAHLRRPQGVRYTLTRNWMAVARTLAQDLGTKLILGVNFEVNSTRVAAAEAQAFVKHIGKSSIESLEVGNEPELYGSLAWYVHNGRKYYGRPSSYSVPTYIHEFARIARAMPSVPIGGPNSGGPSWLDHMGQILSSEPRIGIASMHRYPFKKCSASAHVSIPQLLSPGAALGYATYVGHFARIAHARHLPLRLDEMNAVSCGGQPGVSNSFAAALWSVDALFELARHGIDGVNVHTRPGMSGELFSLSRAHHHWQAVIHPEYYGLMLFAQAAPAGARLLQVGGAAQAKLNVWATRAGGRIRVVLINKSQRFGRRVSLRISGASGTGSLERLVARSAASTAHVTLGGQRLGYRSGAPVGRPSDATLRPAGGRYVVRVPAASAAMLTFGS